MLSKPGLFSQTDPPIIVVIFFLLFVHVFLELYHLKFDMRCELVAPAKADLRAVFYARRKMPQIYADWS